jgi:hypothetical protein
MRERKRWRLTSWGVIGAVIGAATPRLYALGGWEAVRVTAIGAIGGLVLLVLTIALLNAFQSRSTESS